jgi:hypothetical protein
VLAFAEETVAQAPECGAAFGEEPPAEHAGSDPEEPSVAKAASVTTPVQTTIVGSKKK